MRNKRYKDLPYLSGAAIKQHRLQLERAGLKDFLLLFQSIRTFFFMAMNSYKLIKDDESRVPYLIFNIRFMIDAIFSMYALKLVTNKLEYLRLFTEGKATNKIRVNGNNLTSMFIGKAMDIKYSGLLKLYTESCRYAHPTIFYKASKSLLVEEAYILAEKKNKWDIKGKINNRLKLDYIINYLANILYDTQLEIHNEVLVSMYPDKLTPIEWKARSYQLSREGCKDFIKIKRDEFNEVDNLGNGELP